MVLRPEDVRTLTSGSFVVSCIAATIGFIFTTVFLTFNVYHRKKRFMKMSSPKMNVLISSGGLILNCTCLLYGIEYFFRHLYSKTTVICQMRLWLVTFGITMLFGPMFVKSWRVYQIFKNAGVKRVIIRDRKLMLAIVSLLIIDAVLLSLWQGVDPPISHPVTIAIQSSTDIRRNFSAHYTYVYVQECNSGKTEVWVSLMLVWKAIVMAAGLFLAWRTKHIMLPAMRDSACIVISVLATMFLTSHTLMLTSSLRHIPDAVYVINIVLTTMVASLVQIAVFLPKVRFYWKTSLEQQMRMSLSTHEIHPHLALSTGNDFEEELVHLVAANDTLKKCLTQKNSMIHILESHLQNAKTKLNRMTSEREVKVDSGLDISSSSFHDDDIRQSPDGQTAKTPTTAIKINRPVQLQQSEMVPVTPDKSHIPCPNRANSDFTNYRVSRKRPLKRDRDSNTWNGQKYLQSFPTQELDCLREEIDADLTHAHMLSTSLRASISNDIQKTTTNNMWFYDSLKSRQDVVGSVARSYDLEDNSDTYSYVSSYVPCKIPRKKLDYNSIPSPSLNYSGDSLSTTLANDRMYPGQDVDEDNTSLSFPPSGSSTATHGKPIPCTLQFNKYLVSEVDNINKSYYL
ncbi:probable G-protein coupled receptor 156 [Mizuhopecten yessoensis]|uniref:Gamma-aminobutyric acid type B receptor subunit 2 n=1 Tax=Mizuhopecten yessoensis TaxID=6573 RepID=A0A210PHZ2_MIZYE|nr:probable G-protein coupled receptor 156 [Mizuhopecten yessoensis]OWF36093.1 Gamma-aminobutyric acid type B receptor subunit 2 [Mizuhopecten yessoensis]